MKFPVRVPNSWYGIGNEAKDTFHNLFWTRETAGYCNSQRGHENNDNESWKMKNEMMASPRARVTRTPECNGKYEADILFFVLHFFHSGH